MEHDPATTHLTEAHAEAIQTRLAESVHVPASPDEGYLPAEGDLVLSLDIQYELDLAHVGADLSRWRQDHLGAYAAVTPVTFPYIPGYFCFREGPPLLAMVAHLLHLGLPSPDVIVVDGHGLAHPRRFGVACWLGLATGRPSVGCAKSTLVRFDHDPGPLRGDTSPVFVDDLKLGCVLRTQDGIKPLYVSPGSGIHLDNAATVVLGMPGDCRLPDPLRNADQAARAHCRGASPKGVEDLGAIPPAEPYWHTD